LVELGFEFRALYCMNHTPVHFALVILEMESPELFVWANLEP
jgi:hypothetical protein